MLLSAKIIYYISLLKLQADGFWQSTDCDNSSNVLFQMK